MAVRRTAADLAEALDNQRTALEISSKAYDAGYRSEAQRLAVTIYTLVYDDNRRTKSVLSQMGLRSSTQFFSSLVRPTPGAVSIGTFGAPLCTMQLSQGPTELVQSFVPHLDDPPGFFEGPTDFHTWWEQPVYSNASGLKLARRNIASALRNKDGGAHFDEELPEDVYLDLKNSPPALVTTDDGRRIRTLRNAAQATMRQIAWEVEKTLEHLPRLEEPSAFAS